MVKKTCVKRFLEDSKENECNLVHISFNIFQHLTMDIQPNKNNKTVPVSLVPALDMGRENARILGLQSECPTTLMALPGKMQHKPLNRVELSKKRGQKMKNTTCVKLSREFHA